MDARLSRFPVLPLLGVVLAALAAVFVGLTRHWPMVGDAALLHYYVFLIHHGRLPYRDFLDINMPGAYWATMLAAHLPGSVDAAWRLYDLALVALLGGACLIIAWPYSRFAALFATVLFLLIHGQDGIQQAGQRDLAISALLLAAVACLLLALRRGRWPWLLPFGLAAGLAATIKPTAAPLGLLLLLLILAWRMRQRAMDGAAAAGWLAAGLAAMALPLAAMAAWLARLGLWHAWIATERTILPYYAATDRRPLAFTFAHSIAPLGALVALWLLCVVLRGPRWNPLPGAAPGPALTWPSLSRPAFERLLLAMAAAINLAGLLAQGKALPYQRYPFLAFLLLLIAIDLATAWKAHAERMARRIARFTALAGLLAGTLVLAPLALARVHRFVVAPQAFDALLRADLARVNGGALSGRVQCMDSIQDCLPVLDQLGLLPATYVLTDQALLDPRPLPAVHAMRQRFAAALATQPPLAIVVVSGYVFDTGDGYRKLARWPAFDRWLRAHYTLVAERQPPGEVRWWSRPQPEPGYRLYVLNGTPVAPPRPPGTPPAR